MRSAYLVQQGRYGEAREYNKGYQNYMVGTQHFNMREEDIEQNQRFKAQNHHMGKAVNKMYQREQKKKKQSYQAKP